jgi:rod shape determining protein RodA
LAQRNNIWSNIDWVTVILYLVLVFFGWINIYAAVYDSEHQSILDISQRYGKQLLWIIAAFFIAFTVILVDRNFYVFAPYWIYGIIIFLLVLVLFAGTEINNSRSWFTIGSFGFQPSEFGKFATGLALAKFMSSYDFKLYRFKSIATIVVIILLPAILIFLQHDAGSAIIYFSFILVLYREGLSGIVLFFFFLAVLLFVLSLIVPGQFLFIILGGVSIAIFLILSSGKKPFLTIISFFLLSFITVTGLAYLAGWNIELKMQLALSLIIAGVVVLIYSMRFRLSKYTFVALILTGSVLFSVSVDYAFNSLLESHQQERFRELLGIESDPLGAGYNVNQSKIAIGSGGFWGKGFLNGTQTKFNFVPEQSTDFIFCTVGEEWGFTGSIFVITLFVVLLIRLVLLAERQRSGFSRIYGYSVAVIIFSHFVINIGMTIGVMPVIGIPLPFFSYGGSSLWAFTILLFIFLRLDASRLDQLYG